MGSASSLARDAHCLENSDYLLPNILLSEALFLLCLTALSTITVVLELRRLWRRHQLRKSTTAIAQLLERLVWIQGIVDLCFHAIDFFIASDCKNTPIVQVLLEEPPSALFEERTIIYKCIKEGLGLLSIWWHAVTAHTIYCWIVRKCSANRLRGRRLPYLLVAAFTLTLVRLLLWQTLRQNFLGLRIGNVLFDFLAVPLPVVCLLWWSFGAARALSDYNKQTLPVQQQQQQQQQQQHASEGDKEKEKSRHLSRGSPFPGGMSASISHSIKHSARNRVIIARLLRVSIVVSCMWVWIVGVNAALWMRYFRTGHSLAPWLLWVRTILMRLVGFIDMVIMHDLFKQWGMRCFSFWRRRSLIPTTPAAAASPAAASIGGSSVALRKRLGKAFSSLMIIPLGGGGGGGEGG
jgi:hypothetical protein